MTETRPYYFEIHEWFQQKPLEEQERMIKDHEERQALYARLEAGREQGYAWAKYRIKELGYKSMADFVRRNGFTKMSASTINNYLKYGTFPTWQLILLAYALKSTPNAMLSIYGMYDPTKTHKIEQD